MKLLTQKLGQTTKTCSARCYDAKSGDCHCICGGLLHGAGLIKALDIVQHTFMPKSKVGDVEVTRRALREMRHRAIEVHQGVPNAS